MTNNEQFEYEALLAMYTNLTIKHKILQEHYADLDENYDELHARFKNLVSGYGDLRTAIISKNKEHEEVVKQFQALRYESLALEDQIMKYSEMLTDLAAEQHAKDNGE